MRALAGGLVFSLLFTALIAWAGQFLMRHTGENANVLIIAIMFVAAVFSGLIVMNGAVAAMLRLSREVENAVMVAIICDRGDRYLSTGLFDAT